MFGRVGLTDAQPQAGVSLLARSDMPSGALAMPPGQTSARVAFLFNAQYHQVMHGATTAGALARGWCADVDILSPSETHLAYASEIVGPDRSLALSFQRIGSALGMLSARLTGSVIPPKLMTLIHASRRLNRYDAIVLPERTSMILRSLGVTRPRFIHIDHGAGDRAAGFDPRIARFDFALVAGEKQRRRMLSEGLIRPEAHAVVGYPKFDAADRLRAPGWTPFTDSRPTILYNPHFSPELGSWAKHGKSFVEQAAMSGRFNLIVAPHVRMCDSRSRRLAVEAVLAPLARMPHVHVDLGSRRSIDMTYTDMADLYVGDVSSQVYEFLRRPRPCLFLDPGRTEWQQSEDYRHWHYGPVAQSSSDWVSEIDRAFASHGDFRDVQISGFADTFDLDGHSPSRRAAAAIAGFLGVPPRLSIVA